MMVLTFVLSQCFIVKLKTETNETNNDICKRFQSFILGTVPSTPESSAFFLQLGLPSTLITEIMKFFKKALQTCRNLKMPAFAFSWNEKKNLNTELFGL